MLTKKDLKESLDNFQKVIKDQIDDAIVQVVESIAKVVPTKEELRAELGEVESKLGNRLDRMDGDIKDIKRQMNDIKADTPTPQEFQDHDKRIGKLEKAVFSIAG